MTTSHDENGVTRGAKPPSLWRHGDFVKLWTGQTISLVGTQITELALPLTAILVFGAPPFEVGLLATFQFLPFLLFSLPAGVWVDRLSRRPLLVTADVARCLVLGSIPLAAAFGALHIAQLYIVAFLSGCFGVVFEIGYQSYLPSLVRRDQLVEANGKLEASRTAAQIAGPGMGGLLVQALTAPTAIAADALSYLVSALSLLRISTKETPRPSRHERPRAESMGSGIAQGLRYVFGHPHIRALTICTAVINLFGGIGAVVLLIFAVRGLGLSAGIIGGVLALANVGVLVGAVLSGRITRRFGIGPTIIASTVLMAVGFGLAPLATRATAVPILVGYALIGGFGGVIFNVNIISLRQAIAPPSIHGRMNATVKFVVFGAIPLGTFIGGVLGDAIGPRSTLWVSSAGLFVAVLVVLFSPVRGLRATPDREPGHALDAEQLGGVDPAIGTLGMPE